MIGRITGFIKRVLWLTHYVGNPVKAALFLLQRRADATTCTTGRYHGQSFTFRGTDMNAVREVLTNEEYGFLRPYLTAPKAPVVFDIGAHVGLFALWCLQQNPQAALYSLEANPSTYAILAQNVKAQGLANWVALNRAAWQSDEWIMFDNNAESMSSHVTTKGDTRVQGISWASLMQQWPAAVDIMKVDIEGAEESFITAAPDMLDRIKLLVIELHPNRCNSDAVMNLLQRKYATVTPIGGRLSTKPLLLCTEPRTAADSLRTAHA